MSYLSKSRVFSDFELPEGSLSFMFMLWQRRGTLKLSQSLIIRPRSCSSQPAVTSTEARHTVKWFEEFLWALTPQLYVQESRVIMRERGMENLCSLCRHVVGWRQDDYQMCWGGCLDLPAHFNMNVRWVIISNKHLGPNLFVYQFIH